MSGYFDGHAAVYRDEIRKARKPHWCDACCGPISPGQEYAYHFQVYEGCPNSLRRCARCEAIYRHLCSARWDSDEGPDQELDCGHEYSRVFGKPPPEELAALAFWLPGEPIGTIPPARLQPKPPEDTRRYSRVMFGGDP